jgi:hypothetical protein
MSIVFVSTITRIDTDRPNMTTYSHAVESFYPKKDKYELPYQENKIALALVREGKALAISYQNGSSILIWDIASHSMYSRFSFPYSCPLLVTPDGNLCTGGNDDNGEWDIYDPSSGEIVTKMFCKVKSEAIIKCAILRNGQLCMKLSDGNILFWDYSHDEQESKNDSFIVECMRSLRDCKRGEYKVITAAVSESVAMSPNIVVDFIIQLRDGRLCMASSQGTVVVIQ